MNDTVNEEGECTNSHLLITYQEFYNRINYERWLQLSWHDKLELSCYLPFCKDRKESLSEKQLDTYIKTIYDQIEDFLFENPIKIVYFKINTEYYSSNNEYCRQLYKHINEISYIPLKKKEWILVNFYHILILRQNFLKKIANSSKYENITSSIPVKYLSSKYNCMEKVKNKGIHYANSMFKKILSNNIDLKKENIENLSVEKLCQIICRLAPKYLMKKKLSPLKKMRKRKINQSKQTTIESITQDQSTIYQPSTSDTKDGSSKIPDLTSLNKSDLSNQINNNNEQKLVELQHTTLIKQTPISSLIKINSKEKLMPKLQINDHSNKLTPPDFKMCTKLLPEINDESSSSSLFALLRNIMFSMPKFIITIEQAKNHVNDYTKHHPDVFWCKCPPLITSKVMEALFYLSGKLNASKIQDFVPFVKHIPDNCEGFEGPTFVWTETNMNIVSDRNLLILCHHWATFESIQNPFYYSPQLDHPICINANPQMLFHQQEEERFSNPSLCYRYFQNNHYYLVGPIKGVVTGSNLISKVREHHLLINHRPHYVTLSVLIKDSVARLPNGCGNRKLILDKLCESKFFIQNNKCNLLNIVSSHLDRMNNDADPFIKYDIYAKKWRYLHYNRLPEQFYTIHCVDTMFSNIKKLLYQQ